MESGQRSISRHGVSGHLDGTRNFWACPPSPQVADVPVDLDLAIVASSMAEVPAIVAELWLPLQVKNCSAGFFRFS